MSGENSFSDDESSVVVVIKRSPSQEDVTRSPLHQPDLDQEPEIDLEQEMDSQRSISGPDSPNSFMLLPLPLGQLYTRNICINTFIYQKYTSCFIFRPANGCFTLSNHIFQQK